MKTKVGRILATLFAFALIASACGGDDDEPAAPEIGRAHV